MAAAIPELGFLTWLLLGGLTYGDFLAPRTLDISRFRSILVLFLPEL